MQKTAILTILILLLCGTAQSQTTLEWWQFWTDPTIKPAIDSMVADFEEANPDIDVKLTDLTWSNGHEKIVIALASGTGPDILELGSDWIAQFADAGQLAGLGSEIDDDMMELQGWEMSSYKDETWAVPWILGTRVLYVNGSVTAKTMFGDAFLPDRWAIIRFFADSLRAHYPEYGILGSNAPEKHRLYKKFMPFFWTVGARIFTPDGKYCIISSLRAIYALQTYADLHRSLGFVGDQRTLEDMFMNDELAMVQSGDWLLKRIRAEKPDMKFGTTPIPDMRVIRDLAEGVSFLGGEFLAITEASKNKDAAMKFIRHITSPENQIRFCKASGSACPSSRIARQDDHFMYDPDYQVFAVQLERAQAPPVDPDWVHIEAAIEEAVEAVMFKDVSSADALREAQHKIAAIKKKRR